MPPSESPHRQLRRSKATLLASIGALFVFAAGAPSNVAAATLTGVTKIAAGSRATCAIVTGGGVKCWGSGWVSGATTDRLVPGDVTGLSSGVVDIAVGGSHACVVTSGGGAKCWGNNVLGQLGNGTTSNSTTPVDVVGLTSGVASIAAGSSHTCAVTTDGAAKCWGYRGQGVLGDGLVGGSSASPVDVLGLGSGSTSRIWTGYTHSCALTTSGGLKCWGEGAPAPLGGSSSGGLPADVVGLSSGVATADAAFLVTMAVTTGGGVKYWGTLHPLPGNSTPADVPGWASGIAELAVGDYHACALGTGGGLKCIGTNTLGQLGDGTQVHRSTPVDVIGLGAGVAAVTAGGSHSCALLLDGRVKCWGMGVDGQLGNGEGSQQNVAVLVGGAFRQQILFDLLPPRHLSDPPFNVTAMVTTSGLPVTLTAGPPSVCTISGSTITLVGPGDCAVTATQDGDATHDTAWPVVRTFNISDPSVIRLSNISTRGRVSAGQGQLIAGFVIGAGQGNKKVAIVATGPSLATSGVANPLPDPTLKVMNASGEVIRNNFWEFGISADEVRLNGLAPASPLEAAVVVDLPPGAYTAVVEDTLQRTGVSVVAVYELDRHANRLVNIATRGEVRTGDDVLIAGFVVSGNGPQQVAIVATGPSLGNHGITNPLANPTLTLVRSSDQAVLVINDDWQTASNASQLQAAGFAPPNAAEAAILTTLPPGSYTAIVSGVGGTTGISVVGVYAVP